MTLLNTWQNLTASGALFPMVSIFFLALIGWFGYQLFVSQKSGTIRQREQGGWDKSDKPLSIWKNNKLYYVLFLTVIYVIVLAMINSDYRPYNPKKDGIPTQQTDTTRKSAEDIINGK
jgi:hypothetical protein